MSKCKLYVIVLIQSVFGMMQRPAMEASVTMLMPNNHRDRANAIRQITGPMAGIIAPPITGFAYAFIGVSGIMMLDLFTIVVAIGVLFFIHIPQPNQTLEGKTTQGSIIQELRGCTFGQEFKIVRKNYLITQLSN